MPWDKGSALDYGMFFGLKIFNKGAPYLSALHIFFKQ
jgi:hypothetical protein